MTLDEFMAEGKSSDPSTLDGFMSEGAGGGTLTLDEFMAEKPEPMNTDRYQKMYQDVTAKEAEANAQGINTYDYNLGLASSMTSQGNPLTRTVGGVMRAAGDAVINPMLKIESTLGWDAAGELLDSRQAQGDIEDAKQTSWLERTVSGVLESVAQTGTLAATGGLPAVFAGFGTNSYNDAHRQAIKEGKTEEEAAKIARANAAIEVGVMGAFKLAGLDGLESQFLKGAKWAGVKKFVTQTAAELTEEELTTLGQQLASKGEVGDPQAYADTAVQTIATMGLVGAYQKARTNEKVRAFLDRPSRSTAAEVGVEQIATTQKQRQELAAKVSNALTAQQFREQLAAVATSPEEASAIEALVAARAEAAGESLDDYVGKRIKAVEKASLKDTMARRGERELPQYSLAQTAYHGSPHKFDKFTTDHVGKANLTPSAPWGIYFSGSEAVAKYYRDMNAGGTAYQVDLKPSRESYLLWDQPLSKQSDSVRRAIESIANSEWVNINLTENSPDPVGADVYKMLSRRTDSRRDVVLDRQFASQRLLRAGVKGIKQRGNERDGDSSYNYIIFDGADVAIEKILGQGNRVTDRRGEIEFIEDGRAIIRAFESQDITTLTHEVGHLFRRDMQGDLLKRAEGWAGVKDGKWDRAAEEKFARGFERYLRTGRAPTARLKPVFEQFKGWLLGVYKAIRGTPLDVNFNRDIRQVFDELLTPVEAAQDAQVQAEVPAEVQPEELTDTLAEEPFDRAKSVTSTKNAQEDQERIDRGLEPLMAPMRYSNQQAWDDAMKEMDADPDWQDRLISEVSQRPREMSAQENMALLHRKATLHNKYRRALELKEEADATGEEAEIAAAEAYINATAAELADFDEVVHKAGSFFGTGLQARKAFVDDEFNLVKMTTEARAAKGRDLTPEERAELERISTEAKDLNEQITQRDGNKEQLEIDAGIKRAANDARKKPRQKVKLTPEQERDAAIAGIKQKAAKGETTDIKSFLDQLARYFYTQGITEREALVDAINGVVEPLIPNWSRDLTRRAWSGYGDFKPLTGDDIKRKLADLKGQVQQTLKLDALNKRVPLEKTGVERRTPSDEERRLIKQVNELKKKLGVVVTDPAKQLKGALDARKTYYRNRLVDLQAEIDSRQQNVKGSTPPPTDPELEALLDEYKIVKEAHEAIFGNGGLTDEQRLQLAIKAAAKNEQYWNDRLARAQKGDFKSGRKKPQPPQNSYALMRIKARTELVKQQFEELQDLANPKKTPQERALQAAKTRMKNEALRLTEKLANGDFSKRTSTPVVLDEEGNKLKAKLDLMRQQYQQGLERDRWNKLSVWKKLGQRAMDAYDLSRMIMTTGEFSFLLRQGKFAAVSHPVKTARAMREAFRAMKNDETALAIEHGIYSHPKFSEASAAKLHITTDDAKLSRQEELIMGRLTNKLPGIAAFARAGRVFMNKLRFDMYLAMEESLTRNGVATPEERVQIAKFINESTGRGGLGRVGEPAAVALGRVFFSPRYLASRLQMLSGHSMWGGSNRSRKLIAKEYGRIVIGMGMYYTALSWLLGDDDEPATVNLNPTSSDFGKVRKDNVRVDPLAGLSQVATFLARTATQSTTTLQGETKSLDATDADFGDDDWSDVAARFARSKLHPVVGAIFSERSGATMTGEEATVISEALKMSAPITWGDIYQALQSQGLSKGAATSLLAFFGEGVQVHKD